MDSKRIVVLAVIAGLLTTLLAYSQIQKLTRRPNERVEPTVAVVFATNNIAANQRITADKIEVRNIPTALAPSDSITDAALAIGRSVRYAILAGEPIRNGRLVDESKRAGLSYLLPDGYRAVTIGINNVTGVAGLIQPGDNVDVLATITDPDLSTPTTITVLQDVLVLAIAQDTEVDPHKKPVVYTNVTLSVSSNDAEKLALATEAGSLHLVLRGQQQAEKNVTAGWELTELMKSGHPARVNLLPAPEPDSQVITVIRGTQQTEVNLNEP